MRGKAAKTMVSASIERSRYGGLVAGAMESKWFVVLAMATGFAFRCHQYLYGRSLWVDEAMLALNIMGRSYQELISPLDFDQGAPIGFLFLVKTAAVVLGDHEFAYRLFPFLFSLLSIVVFWYVAKLLLEKEEAAVALVFLALNPFLIYYSAEVKQYSSDVFFLLMLYALFIPRLMSDISIKETLWGSVIGALVVWFSHPAVMVLAGFGLSKAAFHVTTRKWSSVPKLIIMGGVWIASGICFYLISLKNLASNNSLINYWGDDFAPVALLKLTTWKWYFHKALEVMRDPLGFTVVEPLVLVLVIAGMAGFFKRSKYLTISILSPLGFVLLASMARLYPIGGRLILFAVPILAIFLARGLLLVGRWNAFTAKAFYPAILAVLFLSILHPTIRLTLNPEKEEIRPAMSFIKNGFASGDVIVIPSTTYPAYSFYRATVPEYAILDAITCRSPRKAEDETHRCLEQVQRFHYVWFLMSHFTKFEKNYFLDRLEQLGEKVDQFSAAGVEVYKYRINS